jgi:hypothetical protein
MGALSKNQFASLRAALEVAKRMGFFHADLEFSSIMKNGFSAILGNPPWKVVGAKDKGVFPAFDPDFMSTAKSQKKSRRQELINLTPEMESAWWNANHSMKSVGNFWSNLKDNRTSPLLAYEYGEGQLDLCTLFLLRAEGLLKENGSVGYIVSHSATFITKNTKPLRQRFFKEWNLREATVFENRAKIFEIDSRVTFATLIGSPNRKAKSANPAFIQGVTAMGDLDGCSASFDGVKQIHANHHRIEIGKSLIERIFSPEIFAIPLITDPREIRLAEELLKPRPGLVRVGDVVDVLRGIESTAGSKSGVALYREDLAKKGYKVPTFEQMFDPDSELIPLYKGSFFSHFDPFYLGHGNEQHYGNLEAKKRAWAAQIEQFGVRKKLYENENNRRFIESQKMAWRKISSSTNQRTLIPTIIETGHFSDDSAYLAIVKTKSNQGKILANMSSLVIDLFSRYQVTSNVTSGIVLSLSILKSDSSHLTAASKLVTDLCTAARLDLRVKFEGEMILHFCQASNVLLPDDIVSVFTNRFAALNRAEPEFFPQLLQYLRQNWKGKRVAA